MGRSVAVLDVPVGGDYRDLTIQMFAAGEAEVRAENVELRADNRVLREMVSLTLGQLEKSERSRIRGLGVVKRQRETIEALMQNSVRRGGR